MSIICIFTTLSVLLYFSDLGYLFLEKIENYIYFISSSPKYTPDEHFSYFSEILFTSIIVQLGRT